MTFDPAIHHRRSIRLAGYDYAQEGAYFVTICTHGRACMFGDVTEDGMQLNAAGAIVESVWDGLPSHYPRVELDAFVIMPNHVHCVVLLTAMNDVGAGFKPARTGDGRGDIWAGDVRAGLKPAPTRHGLPEIIRAFKTFTARGINEIRNTAGRPVWHRNYYEHVIRNEKSLIRIRQYILDNQARWAVDRENPLTVAPEPKDVWRA